MHRFLRVVLAMLVAIFGAGCELNRVLTIKPDGSGQIYERMVRPWSSAASEEKSDKQFNFGFETSPAKFVEKQAEEFGEGVEVTSFKKIATEDLLGYEAVYSFHD